MDLQKLLTDFVALGMNGIMVAYFIREIKSLHKRVDVHDRLISNLLGEDFDSEAIAKGQKYPLHKKPREH